MSFCLRSKHWQTRGFDHLPWRHTKEVESRIMGAYRVHSLEFFPTSKPDERCAVFMPLQCDISNVFGLFWCSWTRQRWGGTQSLDLNQMSLKLRKTHVRKTLPKGVWILQENKRFSTTGTETIGHAAKLTHECKPLLTTDWVRSLQKNQPIPYSANFAVCLILGKS